MNKAGTRKFSRLPDGHHDDGNRGEPYLAAALTFAIFMALTLASWLVVKDLETRNAQERFDKIMTRVIASIEHRLSGYERKILPNM